ncbi:MAG TPA: hypothetical protein VGN79_12425 [Devosia sp.]|jgi:hypothetical protein|nr:hypothetical protein [Devosia sp.]
MIGRVVIVGAVAVALAACKADNVEIRVSTSDIQEALGGDDVTVPFVARFSMFSDLDEEQKAQLRAIEDIVERFLVVDDYQITSSDYTTDVTIEGELPIVVGDVGSGEDAFALYVSPANVESSLSGFDQRVELGTGRAFSQMESQMQGINFMLAADAVHPVSYRLRNDAGSPVNILAGGVQIDGDSHAIAALSLGDGDRTTMLFSGGPYDQVMGAFLMSGKE